MNPQSRWREEANVKKGGEAPAELDQNSSGQTNHCFFIPPGQLDHLSMFEAVQVRLSLVNLLH